MLWIRLYVCACVRYEIKTLIGAPVAMIKLNKRALMALYCSTFLQINEPLLAKPQYQSDLNNVLTKFQEHWFEKATLGIAPVTFFLTYLKGLFPLILVKFGPGASDDFFFFILHWSFTPF